MLEGEDIEGGEGVEGLTELGDGAGLLLAAFAGGLGQGHWGEGWRGGREGGWGRVSGEHASRIGRRSFASVKVLCPYPLPGDRKMMREGRREGGRDGGRGWGGKRVALQSMHTPHSLPFLSRLDLGRVAGWLLLLQVVLCVCLWVDG